MSPLGVELYTVTDPSPELPLSIIENPPLLYFISSSAASEQYNKMEKVQDEII